MTDTTPDSQNSSPSNEDPPVIVIVDEPCDDDDDDDEIEIVSFTKGKDSEVEIVSCVNKKHERKDISASDTSSDTEDLSIVGSNTVLNTTTFYPHYRYMCSLPEGTRDTCPKCYCFVCDVLACDCPTWDLHHAASNSGLWRIMRKMHREQKWSLKQTTLK